MRPVLTVGPCFSKWFSQESRLKSILFPTDLSQESRSVFPYLGSLASKYKSDLTVMHVLPEEIGTNPDARRLAPALGWRQVIARARMHIPAGGLGLGADLLPRIRGVMALGDGDDPRQDSAPAALPPPHSRTLS